MINDISCNFLNDFFNKTNKTFNIHFVTKGVTVKFSTNQKMHQMKKYLFELEKVDEDLYYLDLRVYSDNNYIYFKKRIILDTNLKIKFKIF